MLLSLFLSWKIKLFQLMEISLVKMILTTISMQWRLNIIGLVIINQYLMRANELWLIYLYQYVARMMLEGMILMTVAETKVPGLVTKGVT